jgi:cell division protein FtsB
MANYDALKASVDMDKNGEVMIRLDKGEKLELHKHNVEVRLNKKTGLLVMAFLFLSVLHSGNLAYGLSATSLEELESQLAQENSLDSRLASYRAALIDYIETHNITTNEDLNVSSLDALEEIVQSHMDACNSGGNVASSKNDMSLQGNC